MNDKETKKDRLTLELLTAIDGRSDLSQRHLARDMGVALGLANSYLRRCVRKGFIQIHEAPANRFLYSLTPHGFAEKARLTAADLSSSLSFYRQAAESCAKVFEQCARRGAHHILLCGLSDLAEIALLRARETDLEITGVFDPDSRGRRFFSITVFQHLKNAGSFDIAVLTDLTAPLARYRLLVRDLGEDRVCVPDVLGLGGRAPADPPAKEALFSP